MKGSRSSGCLLGSSSAVNLGILHIVNRVKSNQCKSTGGKSTNASSKKGDRSSNCASGGQEKLQKLIKNNDDLFHGIGKLKGVKVKLHVDQNVAEKHRRVPFQREKLEAEVTRLEEPGIIEKFDSATDWISAIVISPKKDSNEIRLCVDMVEPNRAIKKTRHVLFQP